MTSCKTFARALLLVMIFGAGVALSKQEPVVVHEPDNRTVNSQSGIAIHGYDPVAYIEDHEAVPGSPEITASWQGVEWRFDSARNRNLFLQDPASYTPQYGGFEAYSASQGKTYDIDPTVFDVVDGKLYLHRNDRVRELWQRNPRGYIAEADAAWRGQFLAENQ